MLKCLLREPFKGQASVRALDEGDATGEHVRPPPHTHPACQNREALLLGHMRLPDPTQPVPTGSLSATPPPTLLSEAQAQKKADGKCPLIDG